MRSGVPDRNEAGSGGSSLRLPSSPPITDQDLTTAIHTAVVTSNNSQDV